MKTAAEVMAEIAPLQGWNEQSQKELCLQFIASNNELIPCSFFESFLLTQAKLENCGYNQEIIDCIESGDHLKNCDDDGFCDKCGYQEGGEY